MAQPITCPSSKMIIKLGNGATPTELFAAPCGMTTKGLNFTKTSNEVQVPDCDDPDAPVWIQRAIVSMSAEISENGILAMEARPVWQTWNELTLSRNVQVWLDLPVAQHGGYWMGKFLLTGWNVTADLGNKVQAAITMLSDGPVAWVDAPT